VINLATGGASHDGIKASALLTSIERAVGSAGNDLIAGSAIGNRLSGGQGDDQIGGASGADQLNGGEGADTLFGGEGRDGLGGGDGADRFAFLAAAESGLGLAADVITDFTSGEDRIDLSEAYGGTLAFVGAGQFSGAGDGQVRVQQRNKDQLVQADINGDGVSDMEIVVRNNGLGAGAGDFVL
jgi:Ca2+-binding RTX toxin-like protein